ncbi:hypothetical protein BX611_2350 [Lutibacter oceani]|uniref:Uncharacterized protein n=1 Tax=Lutibacter oceani TaxID=1853311 RepID=A0A3D9RMB1_9FLAO|nr:hypothetical protein [Lutibacter oceani]REE80698.1 hypothetical protein BX611_2350 [Lutibacter oceani]
MKTINKTILALFPNRWGVGYAVFNTPKDLVDYGIGYVQPVSNKKSIERIKKYIDYFKPDIVLIRNIPKSSMRKCKRTKKLITTISKIIKSQNLKIYEYSRTQIKEVFEQFDVSSKFEITKKLIEWFPFLESLGFAKRKKWMTENNNMGIFDAISLGITHFYLQNF